MEIQFDFIVDNYLFKSLTSSDFIVDSKVEPLFNKYKDIWTDDYWIDTPQSFKNLITCAAPYFWAIFNEEGTFIGFMFLYDWKAGGTSAQFHIIIDDKFHGKPVHKVAKKVANELFERFGILRIDCTIPVYNRHAMAFAEFILKAKFEGIHKGYSMKNGKPLDYYVYALTNYGGE